ncbi:hypothetical protein LCGC14_1191930 [marine sediment metagenome]|uniref:Uncharacterized protein n=1 Tax=marine sediment metagenome TaxID=412755 RepID=A0A0F9M6X0_9ZZZZ
MPEREYDPTLQSPAERRSLLRQGVLRLRRLFVPSSQGLRIGDNFITAKDDGSGNTDPFWQRADGSESNLSDTGGGSGSMTTVKEDGTQVGGADIQILDFLGADFDITESPDKEINIVIAAAIARDSELHAEDHAARHADGAADTLAGETVKVLNLNVGSKIKQDSGGASVVWQTKDVINAAIAWQAWNGSAQETIAAMAAASAAGQTYYRLDKPALQKQTITLDANGDMVGVTGSNIFITSNAGSADTLVGIDAMPESRILFLTPTAGHDITLTHNGAPTAGSKMLINGEANVVLDQDHDFAIAIYDPTAVAWKIMVPGSGGGTHPVALATDVSGILSAANIDAAIARDAEVTADIATHAAIAVAHHAKYTDADAIAAVKRETHITLAHSVSGVAFSS